MPRDGAWTSKINSFSGDWRLLSVKFERIWAQSLKKSYLGYIYINLILTFKIVYNCVSDTYGQFQICGRMHGESEHGVWQRESSGKYS